MRIKRLPMVALCLSIAGLATFGVWHVASAGAAPADAGAVSSECQALPAPSASASPTASSSASPAAAATSATSAVNLCVSVQASDDSVEQGQAATWTVQVWAPTGAVTGVTVALTSNLSGELATFTSMCPGGDGSTSCSVGNMATAITASSDQMEAQITIPSATSAGTSVSLTATANATPALATQPSAGTSVTVAAASSPSASASASASVSASATKSAASASAAATPAASSPGVGTIPSLAAPADPTTQVNDVSSPGSISDLLPVITPAAYATSPTAGLESAPAADPVADPAPTAPAASAGNFILMFPMADAEKIGLAVLLLLVGVAFGLRAKDGPIFRVLPGGAPRGAHSGSAVNRSRPSAGDEAGDSSKTTR
jgi:hypothetical protein